MQIKLIIESIEDEEEILQNLNIDSKDSFLICLQSSSSISSWIVDYYFTKIYSNEIKLINNIIGFYDMFIIYQLIQSSSLFEFFQLCKNKLKQIKNDLILENYNNYLNQYDLIDIIDLFHQLKLESFINTIILSINNIKNDIDRLLFEYLLELSSSCCVYNVKTKLITNETKENLFKLIVNRKISIEKTNRKNSIKHILCTYLSLLLDTRNEHVLIHCLVTCARNGIEREIIVGLKHLSKNEYLTIHQILLSFLRHKELILNRTSSLQQDFINNEDDDDELFHILDKYYIDIREFFDFIEQLQMIIEENKYLKIESIVTLRKLLELILKQLCKNISFNQNELIIKEIIKEFCQCFQTIQSFITCTSPNQSTLTDHHFLRSIAYLCAKQRVDLPVFIENNDDYENVTTKLRATTSSDLLQNPLRLTLSVTDQTTDVCLKEKVINFPIESVFVEQSNTKEKTHDQLEQTTLSNKNQYRQIKSYRCLELSTIHETSFESDSIINNQIDYSTIQLQSTKKRQPLQEIDINSFNHEERKIENEKNRYQNLIVLTLVSDNDQENLPITSTKIESSNKKQKK
ncbi:unnamed protein product [Rotaria sordida]|uniref:Uncharacterized protein n=1 Tax=Rotaria sordida TaxID=392033 RepID=A0A815FIJ8_9BILA|nr:unnamed protein product [Rotaria sordida]CAF1588597.1 unnamed protein product [Rotaria sordida]